MPSNSPQLLHRDGGGFPGQYVAAMIWLDPFDPEVLHGATTHWSGARRRALLISYAATNLRDQHKETAALRSVCIDTSETFV